MGFLSRLFGSRDHEASSVPLGGAGLLSDAINNNVAPNQEGAATLSNAIQSLGIEAPEVDNSNGLCIQSLRVIATDLIRRLGYTPESVSDNLLVVICMFTSAGSVVLANEIGGDLASIRTLVPLNIFHKHSDGESLADIAQQSESLLDSDENAKIKTALIGNFAKWLKDPTEEQFTRICELVKLLESNLSDH